MRKIFFLSALILGGSLAYAQKTETTTAVIAYNKRDYAEAKKNIDEAQAIVDEKTPQGVNPKDLAKFYYYKGEINMQLLNDTALAKQYPNALEEAYEGFNELYAFEQTQKKQKYTGKMMGKVPYLSRAILLDGYAKWDAEDYEGAKAAFQKSYDLNNSEMAGKNKRIDTNTLYNMAILENVLENPEGAASIYKQVLDLGYHGYVYSATMVQTGQKMNLNSKKEMEQGIAQGIISDPVVKDSRPNVYTEYYNLLVSLEKNEEAAAVIAKARTEYPENLDLIKAELQGYLDRKEYDKAVANLKVAIEKDPQNKLFHFVLGQIYHTELKETENAIAAYGKALEIDPNYVDALYMSGIVWIDQANATMEEMNNLPLSAKSKYNKLDKQKDEEFAKALPYFEKAYEINPEDSDTIQALAEVYRRTGDYKKSMEFQKKLQ